MKGEYKIQPAIVKGYAGRCMKTEAISMLS